MKSVNEVFLHHNFPETCNEVDRELFCRRQDGDKLVWQTPMYSKLYFNSSYNNESIFFPT